MPRMPEVHRFARRSEGDQRRVRAMQLQASAERRGSAHQRGYNGRWVKASAGYLIKHALCVCCLANARTTPAALVDHIEPHRGDKGKFWDSGNWQALCVNCHSSIKALIERRWTLGIVDAHALRLNRPLPEFFTPAS